MKRDIRKSVRLSKKENEKIEVMLKEHGISFSNFVRNLIFNYKIKSKVDKKVLYELNKIGNNLNQIAKAVNTNNRNNILLELIEIERQLKEIKC